MYGVMIVDDHARYRRLLRAMLKREDDFQVLAEAGDAGEALEMMDQVDQDLIIMHLNMLSMNGFEATKMILERHPSARVVLISGAGCLQNYSRMAQEAGAVAFVRKVDLDIGVLRQALQP